MGYAAMKSRAMQSCRRLPQYACVVLASGIISLACLTAREVTVAAGPDVEVKEAEETARLLATLLDSGRTMVDRNQELINDRHKGDKGFTSEVFENQTVEEFRVRTGVDLRRMGKTPIPSLAQQLLPKLLQASKEVVAAAQLVINQRGIGYKNFIPATFARQAAASFSARSPVMVKQVALRPRNPKNSPDDYEAEVLRQWGTQPDQAAEVSAVLEDGRALRLMLPLRYDKSCLACHGSPVGILDISGYPREGAREGEIAGGISVSLPVQTSR
jgi:hypothetical protein